MVDDSEPEDLAAARAEGKADVIIYDYVDDGVPVLARMHQKRLAGYRAMGYEVSTPAASRSR